MNDSVVKLMEYLNNKPSSIVKDVLEEDNILTIYLKDSKDPLIIIDLSNNMIAYSVRYGGMDVLGGTSIGVNPMRDIRLVNLCISIANTVRTDVYFELHKELILTYFIGEYEYNEIPVNMVHTVVDNIMKGRTWTLGDPEVNTWDISLESVRAGLYEYLYRQRDIKDILEGTVRDIEMTCATICSLGIEGEDTDEYIDNMLN